MESDPKFERLCVIGLGYVGLPTAAVFASRGVEVLGVDINANTVATINAGKIHIVEPDLDILVNGAVATGKLTAAAEPLPADAYIVAVPPPFTEDRQPDLSYLDAAADALVLPVEAHMIARVPSSNALAMATTMPRSLNEPVGLQPSSLK